MALRATFSENVIFQLQEGPQKFAKIVFQLSNYSKNLILAWFFQKRSAFQDFLVCIKFSKWQLNLVPGLNNMKSALVLKAITTEGNNGFP